MILQEVKMDKRWILISLAGLFLMALIASCTQATPVAEGELDDVEALIIERCSDCHSADRVFQEDYSEAEWSEVIDEMVEKGAEVNAEEKQAMIDWLVARD